MPSRETIQRKMRHVEEFRTIPAVVKKFLEVLENPRLSLEDIATIVSKDQMLTARLLKTVNSPFFGFIYRVATIRQALLLLGLNTAKALLLGVSLFRHVRGMEGLWAHSVGTAILAEMVARRHGLIEQGELFVAGLLHDIGKVFLSVKFPQEYRRALLLAREKGALIVDAEREVFDATHAEIAGWALERWYLPSQLIEAIKYHHEPSLAPTWSTQTAVVHISDIVARAQGYGSGGDALVPLVDDAARLRLNLSEAGINALIADSQDPFREAEGFLSCL
jgi:putative nucleotidyltransferase with HDIG domain